MKMSDLLRAAVWRGASDLHCSAGAPATMRIHGNLVDMTEEILSADDTLDLFEQISDDESKSRLKAAGDVDISYAVQGLGRFRINVYKQKRSIAIAARMIAERIPTLEELNLPAVLVELSRRRRGLVLVTGPTGSGKSTTVAAMVNQINSERRCNIITLEDPIEYIHTNKQSLINQREIGVDAESFVGGLRAVLREDPDVIVVGEMRDLDTMRIAVQAAETGHLVLATLHTPDAAQTVDRIIDVFPSHQQQQIRLQLSMTLQGIVSQHLLPKKDGNGRIAACEILVSTPAVRNLIREGKAHQLHTVLQTGNKQGMQSMDASLEALCQMDAVDADEALSLATDPERLLACKRKKIGKIGDFS